MGQFTAAPLTVPCCPLETCPEGAIPVPACGLFPEANVMAMCDQPHATPQRSWEWTWLPSLYLLNGFKVRKEKVGVIVGHLVLQH